MGLVRFVGGGGVEISREGVGMVMGVNILVMFYMELSKGYTLPKVAPFRRQSPAPAFPSSIHVQTYRHIKIKYQQIQRPWYSILSHPIQSTPVPVHKSLLLAALALSHTHWHEPSNPSL